MKSKGLVNMSKLDYHGLNNGAGQEGGKPKPKRRRMSNLADIPLQNRLQATPSTAKSHSSTNGRTTGLSEFHLLSPSSQPYTLKQLTIAIIVCAGCRLGYVNRSPPYDVCVVHQETKQIKNPLTQKDMTVAVNAHYHASKSCIQMVNSSFESSQLIIPVELKQKVQSSPIYKQLFLQEFEI